jgi:hypothetical protein
VKQILARNGKAALFYMELLDTQISFFRRPFPTLDLGMFHVELSRSSISMILANSDITNPDRSTWNAGFSQSASLAICREK